MTSRRKTRRTECAVSLRGLTLIEVLASLVLLSVIATVCVPLLERSSRLAGNSERTDYELWHELTRLACEVVHDQQDETGERLNQLPSFIDWPEASFREPISIERVVTLDRVKGDLVPLPEENFRIDGHWVRFSYGKYTVYRWLPKATAVSDPKQPSWGGK